MTPIRDRFLALRSQASMLFTRSRGLTLVAVSCVCSIIYLTWFLPSLSTKNRLERLLPAGYVATKAQPYPDSSPSRLVVFGDSWSDNGQYLIDMPPKSQVAPSDGARGQVWTEWLCSAISCIHHDNFARSLPRLWDSGFSGPVVSSDLLTAILLNSTSLNATINAVSTFGKPLADFRTQVQQWLRFEKQQSSNSQIRDVQQNGTIFTIWFSLWDIWYISGLDIAGGQYAVTKTIDALFGQMDLIADNWASGLKIIMLEAIDLTFLPGWLNRRVGARNSDQHGEFQRRAVALVQQWNQALYLRATQWRGGSVYVYSINKWLLDQVREKQLFDSGLTDANGLGTNQTPWSNVRSGCKSSSKFRGDLARETRCPDSKTYLFWDDMHPGSEAMRMVGEGIARDIIAANDGSSWFARELNTDHKDKEIFPPQNFSSNIIP